MSTTHPHPNIWAQMCYTPPRGPCAQKLSMLTTCPCHRFMIHPLKAATSFECDGCGHHASFHRMANEGEEAVVRGWRDEMKEGTAHGRSMQGVIGVQEGVEGALGKRRRIEGPPPGAWGAGEDEEDEGSVEEVIVDMAVMKEIERRLRETEDVVDDCGRMVKEQHKELEEQQKELERERVIEAETSGRRRKRKGR